MKGEIILFGDFNENVYTGRIEERLVEAEINMTEQCLKTNKVPLTPTHVRSETCKVDAYFAAEGAKCLSACLLPEYGGVGNHRVFILDFFSASFLGTVFPRIVHPSARKLNCDSK